MVLKLINFLLFIVQLGRVYAQYAEKTSIFKNPLGLDKPFQHMVVERVGTGRIYIGGVNRLYELEPVSLNVRVEVITGPQEDSIDCGDKKCKNGARKQLMDNNNKALAISRKDYKLIECSTLFQGRCRLRNMYNISIEEEESTKPIVANTKEASTVAFVAPGPPDPSKIDVLYVASTFTDAGNFRDEIPAVASLALKESHPDGNVLDTAQRNINSETQMFVERSLRRQYKIDYVSGFSSGNFSYFLTRQRQLVNGPTNVHSKLVRLCHGDKFYYSYTEVPLVCKTNKYDYNLVQDAYVTKPGYDLAKSLQISTDDDVLFAVFSRGISSQLAVASSRDSAVCVYSLKDVAAKFLENIQECNLGNAYRGLDWFKTGSKCTKTNFQSISGVACGNEVNYPLGGSIPIQQAPLLTVEDARLTAVAATTTHSYTVIFLATNDGRIKKAVVEKPNSGFIYNTVEIGSGLAILPDMDLDTSGEYLLVLTLNSLTKVRLHSCSTYSRCKKCVGARDPFCGWCALASTCNLRRQCNQMKHEKMIWLSYTEEECTAIREVVPDKMQITFTEFLRLKIDNLVAVTSGQLSCVFSVDTRTLKTGATHTPGSNDSIQCPTPQTSLLPPIPNGKNSITAQLAVQIDQGPDFATTKFVFYDCSTYTSCSDCVKSQFPCDWCAETHQCTANYEDNCRGQHIINGLNRRGSSSTRGPQFCPQIISDKPDIYLPSGTTKEIQVEVRQLQDFQTSFECQFQIEHSIHKKPAKRRAKYIICNPMQFVFFERGINGTSVANFSVLWGGAGGKALDNVNNIRVIMYKCEVLANNCGLCLTLDTSDYDCGWCATELKCTTQRQCTAPTLNSHGKAPSQGWLAPTPSVMCPGVQILDFYPKSGPIEGGTNVTITGVNLGRKFSDIEHAVKMNNVQCRPIREEYVISQKIVCRTESPPHNKPQDGPVIIRIKEEISYAAVSTSNFAYVEPEIIRFHPLVGPMAGGSIITIEGRDLDAGSHVRLKVAGVDCSVLNRSTNQMQCRIGQSTSDDKSGVIEMFMDKATKISTGKQFTFKKNPTISSVRPEKATVSGGVLLEVRGQGFHIIQEANLFATLKNRQGQVLEAVGMPCALEDQEIMMCPTPNLNSIIGAERLDPINTRTADYGLSFDGVRLYRNMSKGNPNFKPMIIYPDPEIAAFSDGPSGSSVKYFKDDYMTIKGKYMDLAAREEDVKIFIGQSACNLTALANEALTCKPPSEEPIKMNPLSIHPEVSVLVGDRKYDIGFLSYSEEPSRGGIIGGVSMPTIIAVVVIVAFVVIVACALFIAYRRKNTRHTRQMKNLKAQMDTIEMKVASECKEAFAELQTSMSGMTAEIHNSQCGIPFLSYRDYAAQVLFPNSVNHPVLRDLEPDPNRPNLERGLYLFNQLLMNKTFLLHFIRTMEANKYFMSKDRVYVGSLLMVILQEKMEYCTDILKTLLSDLIEKTVERRYQPKILFRRSESVAERMLAAWFTFLMYRYLVDCAGQPLFLLYWALKQQVEKGPQDSMSYEARYSLSEEKLLRQSVDFHPMTVFVIGMDGQTLDIPVQVLDCDTISQVKEKCLDAMYRTTPFSRRPTPSDLDLEWRTGTSGRSILSDLDTTTKSESGGWKRVNTLSHYKVPNKAYICLVPRQASLYNLSLLSQRSDKSSTFSLRNSPTLNRALNPLSASNAGMNLKGEDGYKQYHLVKPNDGGGNHKEEENGGKMVSEIYLTRLLTTKGTLQKFMEDFFESVFTTSYRGTTLPVCIKYMFDFMDDQSLCHGIQEADVVHTWKSNALPLRFWVNLIKNPHFLFDIPRPTKIEGCLSVVAQTLMDACSTQDHQLTKDSPSSKLLFARDILHYREWVDRYYADIHLMPQVSDQDMNAFLAEESRSHHNQLHVYSALNELYKYLEQYKDPLALALQEDEFCQRARLPMKLEQLMGVINSPVII